MRKMLMVAALVCACMLSMPVGAVAAVVLCEQESGLLYGGCSAECWQKMGTCYSHYDVCYEKPLADCDGSCTRVEEPWKDFDKCKPDLAQPGDYCADNYRWNWCGKMYTGGTCGVVTYGTRKFCMCDGGTFEGSYGEGWEIDEQHSKLCSQ